MSIFVPVMIYHNAETDKSKILSDNKGKAAIYLWTHISGKIYIGSTVDLSKRMSKYYTFSWLNQTDNYISRALLHHTYSAFSLSILEYIDITGLSKEEARELILEREQYYLDLIFLNDESNTYNILKEAGSSLGYIHLAETKAAISEALKGKNNTNFGKTGDKHPMYGKSHSAETLAKMSKAKTKDSHPMFGKTHSLEAPRFGGGPGVFFLKTQGPRFGGGARAPPGGPGSPLRRGARGFFLKTPGCPAGGAARAPGRPG